LSTQFSKFLPSEEQKWKWLCQTGTDNRTHTKPWTKKFMYLMAPVLFRRYACWNNYNLCQNTNFLLWQTTFDTLVTAY